MQKRDFQDAVAHAPLKLKLGDETFAIEPLRRKASREWKRKVSDVVEDRQPDEPGAAARCFACGTERVDGIEFQRRSCICSGFAS